MLYNGQKAGKLVKGHNMHYKSINLIDKTHDILFILFVVLMAIGLLGLPVAVYIDFHSVGIL
jgi:hypothetical protein